jgi:hypothetical protein
MEAVPPPHHQPAHLLRRRPPRANRPLRSCRKGHQAAGPRLGRLRSASRPPCRHGQRRPRLRPLRPEPHPEIPRLRHHTPRLRRVQQARPTIANYAFYDRAHGDWLLDLIDFRHRIDQIEAGVPDEKAFLADMQRSISRVDKDLHEVNRDMATMPGPPPPPPASAQDPIVRQITLEGASILTPGKPTILGSLDVPGTTRHLDVEVAMELVR